MATIKATFYLLTGFLACTILAGGVAAQGFATGPVAVIVNGEKISAAEVEKLLKHDTPPAHPLTAKQKEELWNLAVDMVINDALMRQFLAKNTPPVSAEQIAKEMDVLKEALKKQDKDMTLEKFLKNSDQTEAELKEEMIIRLRWKHLVTQKLPDAMVRKYYDANKPFFDKVFVRASHILLKVPNNATPQQKQAIKDKLTQIRQDILAGKIKFEDAAKKYSDCPSKEKGGDIGHFPYKFAVAEPFAQMAFSLKKDEVGDLLETNFGFHIIKVTDRTKGQDSKFEEIIDMVRDVYAQDVGLFQSIVTEQRKTATIKTFPPKF
jgi:parvulin-like peptidyl-prolyl isomerase